MLTEICAYLRNWFELDKLFGTFAIIDGAIAYEDGNSLGLADGQYFRVIGSVFNDGVHRVGDALTSETFEGSVWPMGVPPNVLTILGDIEAWMQKYQGLDSPAMTPYSSESFAGYSYSKGGGAANSSGVSITPWKQAFADRLSPYKKL